MHVTVISPEAAIFDGQADALTIPAYDGSFGVLPRHAAMMTLLGDGVLTIRRGESADHYRVKGGFVQIAHDSVRVVAEHVQGERHA